MTNKDILESVEKLVLPLIENHKFEFVEVEFVKEGADWFLRIYIDKPGGIGHDDCQLISNEISPLLDEKDIITEAYFLEISSPGLERPLKTDKDFEKYRGEEVELKLFKPMEGVKKFTGTLKGLIDGFIVISNDKGLEVRFEREKISVIKRVIQFWENFDWR